MRVGAFEVELTGQGSWLSESAIHWAAERMWQLIGGRSDYSGPPLLNLIAADAQAPHALLEGPDTEYAEDDLPLLFRTRSGPPVEAGSAEPLEMAFDPLALAFFMMARWEETLDGARDRHGRFPARSSVAYRLGFLDRPIVDEWALVLRNRIEQIAPRALDRPARYEVCLSHDVDAVRRFAGPADVLRCAVGALVRRRGPREAIRQVRMGSAALRGADSDPFQEGVRRLMRVSERHGVRSAFYFKTAAPGPFDPYYDIADPAVLSLIEEVVDRGHEIGFHPGYETLDSPARLREEKEKLTSTLGPDIPIRGGRQHYLRFQTPRTWRHWEDVGLEYDSTLGFADHVGFRCGTSHPYPVFDLEEDRCLSLLEVPLIVMDTTLFKYMGLDPDAAMDVTMRLAERCRAVGGTLTILWHNTAFEGAYYEWSRIYEDLIEGVMDPPGPTGS